MATTALVFASYFEAPNLSELLGELTGELDASTVVVIADDSGPDYRAELENVCRTALKGSKASLAFNYADIKSGRGGAIRRSFADLYAQYPDLNWFVEADSDGSHRAPDILTVLRGAGTADLLIGSRYIRSSKIIGWPLSRRALSRVLNWTIPKLLRVRAHDLTNGLRGYTRRAVEVIITEPPRNAGFIYLSEVAELLARRDMNIVETPITFNNRIHGTSTVGWAELTASLRGLTQLLLSRR